MNKTFSCHFLPFSGGSEKPNLIHFCEERKVGDVAIKSRLSIFAKKLPSNGVDTQTQIRKEGQSVACFEDKIRLFQSPIF
jgi:hypothetical protein